MFDGIPKHAEKASVLARGEIIVEAFPAVLAGLDAVLDKVKSDPSYKLTAGKIAHPFFQSEAMIAFLKECFAQEAWDFHYHKGIGTFSSDMIKDPDVCAAYSDRPNSSTVRVFTPTGSFDAGNPFTQYFPDVTDASYVRDSRTHPLKETQLEIANIFIANNPDLGRALTIQASMLTQYFTFFFSTPKLGSQLSEKLADIGKATLGEKATSMEIEGFVSSLKEIIASFNVAATSARLLFPTLCYALRENKAPMYIDRITDAQYSAGIRRTFGLQAWLSEGGGVVKCPFQRTFLKINEQPYINGRGLINSIVHQIRETREQERMALPSMHSRCPHDQSERRLAISGDAYTPSIYERHDLV